MTKAPSASDLAEISRGKGSPRDRAEAAGGTRRALRRGKGGLMRRRKVSRPKSQSPSRPT